MFFRECATRVQCVAFCVASDHSPHDASRDYSGRAFGIEYLCSLVELFFGDLVERFGHWTSIELKLSAASSSDGQGTCVFRANGWVDRSMFEQQTKRFARLLELGGFERPRKNGIGFRAHPTGSRFGLFRLAYRSSDEKDFRTINGIVRSVPGARLH